MLDVLGWTPLSQRRQEALLILFYKILNGLTQVPFKGVLVEAYMGSRRNTTGNFDRLAIQLASIDSCFSLKFIIFQFMERACFH